MTLQTYRDRLRLELSDLDVETWEDDQLDQALRQALQEYSHAIPDEAITTLTFTTAVREISVSTLARLLDIQRVWLPYTAADPEHPPNWRTDFELWPGSILYIADDPKPAVNDVARIWFTRTHTLNGLDTASADTILTEHTEILVAGGAAYAAYARARALAETFGANDQAYRQVNSYAFQHLNQFRALLNRIREKPAGGLVALAPARRRRVPRA